MNENNRIFYPPVGTGTIELKVSSEETNGELSMFLQTLPVGEGTNAHLHRNCEETGYVLEGRIKVSLGDEIKEFGVGDSLFVPRNIPHAISNAGDTTARFLFITTPGGLEGYFQEISDQERSSPDLAERIQSIAKKHGLEVVGPPLSH